MFDQQHRSTERSEEHKTIGSAGEERGREVQPVTESLCRNPEPSGEAGKDIATDLEGSVGTDSAAFTMQVRCGKPGGGKGPLIQVDKSATLSTCNVQTLFQPVDPIYAIDQDTVKSVTYITEGMTPTISTGHPHAVFQPVETVSIEGNGSRPSHNGDGYSATDKSYTLNATEVHGVAYKEPICFEPGIMSRVGGYTGTICSTLRASLNDNS